MASALRTNLLKLHLWVGLHLAIYFVLMFITGAALVFRGELNNLVQPIPAVTSPAGQAALRADQLFTRVSEHYPNATIYSLPAPDVATTQAVTLNLFDPVRGPIIAITDPYTGAVLAEHKKDTIVQYIRDLHASLLIPRKIGFLLVSSSSLILFFSVVTGLISYRRFWRGYGRLPAAGATPRGRWGGWHRLLGVWMAPFLLIISLTGLYFFAADIGIDGSTPPAPAVSQRDDTRPPGFGADTILAATTLVAEQHPNFRLLGISLPDGPSKPITLKGVNEPGGIMSGQSYAVDPVTLTVLGGNSPWDSTGLRKFSPWLIALHYGKWGGLPVRILWVAFAIGASVLIFAGVRVFLARTAGVSQPAGQGISRFWRGMGVLRFGYVLLLLGLVAITVLKYLM